MESVVDQAFSDILFANPAGFLERSQVDNAFMRHAPVATRVEDWKSTAKASGDVVGAQDGYLGSLFHAIPAHHGDVSPGYRQNTGAAPGRS